VYPARLAESLPRSLKPALLEHRGHLADGLHPVGVYELLDLLRQLDRVAVPDVLPGRRRSGTSARGGLAFLLLEPALVAAEVRGRDVDAELRLDPLAGVLGLLDPSAIAARTASAFVMLPFPASYFFLAMSHRGDDGRYHPCKSQSFGRPS
jgi:hypothetical protein